MLIEHKSLPNDVLVNSDISAVTPTMNNDGKMKCVDLLKNKSITSKTLEAVSVNLLKQLKYLETVPRVAWIEDEVDKMNIIENLQYAIIENSPTDGQSYMN